MYMYIYIYIYTEIKIILGVARTNSNSKSCAMLFLQAWCVECLNFFILKNFCACEHVGSLATCTVAIEESLASKICHWSREPAKFHMGLPSCDRGERHVEVAGHRIDHDILRSWRPPRTCRKIYRNYMEVSIENDHGGNQTSSMHVVNRSKKCIYRVPERQEVSNSKFCVLTFVVKFLSFSCGFSCACATLVNYSWVRPAADSNVKTVAVEENLGLEDRSKMCSACRACTCNCARGEHHVEVAGHIMFVARSRWLLAVGVVCCKCVFHMHVHTTNIKLLYFSVGDDVFGRGSSLHVAMRMFFFVCTAQAKVVFTYGHGAWTVSGGAWRARICQFNKHTQRTRHIHNAHATSTTHTP